MAASWRRSGALGPSFTCVAAATPGTIRRKRIQAGSDGVEVFRIFCSAVQGQESPCAISFGDPSQSLSRGFCSTWHRCVRRCLSIFRSALLISPGAAITSAQLRCQDLRLSVQTSQGSSLRATPEQRHWHGDGRIFRKRTPPITGPPRYRSLLTLSGENADNRLCVRSMSASVSSGRSARVFSNSASNAGAGTAGLQKNP